MAQTFLFTASSDVSCVQALMVLLACTCFVLSTWGLAGQMTSLIAVIEWVADKWSSCLFMHQICNFYQSLTVQLRTSFWKGCWCKLLVPLVAPEHLRYLLPKEEWMFCLDINWRCWKMEKKASLALKQAFCYPVVKRKEFVRRMTGFITWYLPMCCCTGWISPTQNKLFLWAWAAACLQELWFVCSVWALFPWAGTASWKSPCDRSCIRMSCKAGGNRLKGANLNLFMLLLKSVHVKVSF